MRVLDKVADYKDCPNCTAGIINGNDCTNCDGTGFILVYRN